MLNKIIIECGDEAEKWLLAMIAVIIRVTGEEIAVRVSKPGDKDPARIRYRAVGASDAITDLGHSTVVGIIFSHLIEHGPCTAR